MDTWNRVQQVQRSWGEKLPGQEASGTEQTAGEGDGRNCLGGHQGSCAAKAFYSE
jgi:hypothetical protein